jgi:predicted aspartyl protease
MSLTQQEATDMRRVTTEVTLEKLKDLLDVHEGQLPPSEVRQVVVPDALVDMGASSLSLPTSLIRKLGLTKVSTRRTMSSNGAGQTDVYAVVRLTIQGRDCNLDVLEVPDGVPVLIGQVPLELLDFVVDPVNRKLIGNPAHGGEHVLEMY